MMTMHDAIMRTIVDIPKEQLDALAHLCEQQKISRAEAVRRAVDRLLKESSAAQKDAGFGLWKSKRIDSRKFVEKLRSEWNER
jgi:metal-responsive CopG/Arc/MetJ family transcriptional regulator